MTNYSDAELALGLSRHLRVYQMGTDRAALEQLELAGQLYDVAFRLRGSTTSSADRVRAIGLDAGLGRLTLQAVMAALETLGWISITRRADGQPEAVTESIPVHNVLIESSQRVFEVFGLDGSERAALRILRATTLQPLLRDEALAAGAFGSQEEQSADSDVEAALRHLLHTGLVRQVLADDGRAVLFNPNIWVGGDDLLARAALRAADARATSEVGALLEEIAQSPGIPDVQVVSTTEQWVKFAIAQGLIQRSVIQTSDGREQGFLFSPHLGRDPFGLTAGDASGQVRQLVGSMIYATTFAQYKLRDPEVFLTALINRGVAGNVSNIGTDYPMLERAGIVRIVPGQPSGRFRMELLQSEVAEDARRLLSWRDGSGSSTVAGIPDLQGQRAYVHLEEGRAKLAKALPADDAEEARLIAALRDQVARPEFRGGSW